VKEFHILNLGAGVQSTALYLMSLELRKKGIAINELEPSKPEVAA
jgi:hypothetical protein